MQVTLTKVYITDKKKDGTPLVGKFGPYKKVSVKTAEHADLWLSGFAKDGDETLSWQVGSKVNIVVEQNGEFHNFKVAGKTELLEERVTALEERMKHFLSIATGKQIDEVPPPTDEPAEEEMAVEEIPF